MKYYIVLIIVSATSAIQLQLDESYCCRFASTMEHCHDTCLEMTKTDDPKYLKTLESHFPINCPKNSPDLIEFWDCITSTNGTAAGWPGRHCCENAVINQCRSACLKSDSRDDIALECRADYEESLYSCIFKQESKQQCCGKRPGLSRSCRHLCNLAFRAESGPSPADITKASSCDATMATCMTNFTTALRKKSAEKMHCCEQAPNVECQQACRRILQTTVNDRDVVSDLIDACGDVVPHEPLWKCFLENPVPSPPSGPFVTKVQCCTRAMSYNCKDLCSKLFGNPWSDPVVWNKFEIQCEHNTDEIELQQCLQEVNEPCRMGCSGLSFCTNFNNRPTSLFRSCDAQGDDMAREYFNSWTGGTIRLPLIDIPVKDIRTCEPDKWKAVACSLQIKPCGTRSGESIICKTDCLSLLNKCADKDRFYDKMMVEELCENFSPSHLQSNCISLSTYSRPSRANNEDKSDVTQPCHPNPCSDGQSCVINRKTCDGIRECPKFTCLPGCKMGHGSKFIVSHGSVVRVPDSSRGDGCFKSCVCSTSGSLHPCTALPCTDERQSCKLAGQSKSHGSKFFVDCNFCTCYGGKETCTTRQCPTSSEEKRRYTGMACNCHSYYSPVCGGDGRTYPNACVAVCLGQTEQSISQGSCLSKNPCDQNPCKQRERCVPTPRVCLTNIQKCYQYECIPRHKQCSRLLKSAIPLLHGKVYKHHQLRYSQSLNILSSSHFFSNAVLLANDSGMCDVNNQQFDNICKLTRSKSRSFSYSGACRTSCDSRYTQPVCGQDGLTYSSSCMADANGVLIDYLGSCKSVGLSDENNKEGCNDVVCPPISNPDCTTVRPPGSCCSVCGGMLRVLINPAHLQAISSASWNGPVTVRDIIWLLRRQLHVLQCQIYGQLTTEGDMAIVVVSTVNTPSLIQEEACTREAERLSTLINKRSPTLTSYLILSPLTAATLSPSDPGGAASRTTASLTVMILLTIFHKFVRQCVT